MEEVLPIGTVLILKKAKKRIMITGYLPKITNEDGTTEEYDYSACLFPEGIIEFIPETKKLITELNNLWDEFENQNISILNFQNKKTIKKLKIPELILDFNLIINYFSYFSIINFITMLINK